MSFPTLAPERTNVSAVRLWRVQFTGQVGAGFAKEVSAIQGLVTACYLVRFNPLTSVDSQVSGASIGDRSGTSWVSASQVGSVRKTEVLDRRIEVSLQLVGSPAYQRCSFHAEKVTHADGSNWMVIGPLEAWQEGSKVTPAAAWEEEGALKFSARSICH